MTKKNKSIIIILMGVLLMLSAGCGKSSTTVAVDEAKTGTEIAVQENGEMDIEKIYMTALGNYIKEQLGLEEYDNKIAEIGCIPVDEEYKSENQKNGDMGLKYIYIRNELHLDRLADDDMELLKESVTSTEAEAQDLVMEMVVRTFENCISPLEIKSDEDKEVQTLYDEYITEQDNPRFVNMNSLVLQIATQSEYDENDEIVDEAKDAEKEEKLIELAGHMEEDMDGLLGEIPIRVFVDPVQ